MLKGRLFSNIYGFSMVGAISAAGLMGGLALVLAQMSRQQMVFQKRSQSQSEVEAISQRIGRMLYNPRACLNTVRASSFPTGTFTSTQTFTVPAIKNQNGGDVYAENQTYGNDLVKVSSLKLKNLTSIGGAGNIKAKLQVTMEKTSKAVTGYKKAIRTYDLVVARNPFGVVTACETDLSAAKREICEELGRTYVAGPPSACLPVTANLTCPTPNAGDPALVPVGFETDGTQFGVKLKCADLNIPPAPAPHPTGYNCFLLALHKGNHGQSGATFQPALTTRPMKILEDDPGTTAVDYTIPGTKDNVPAIIQTPPEKNWYQLKNPVVVTLLDRWQTTSTTLPACPTGYTSRFINPMYVVEGGTGSLGWTTVGASAAYMQHYCCI